MKNTFTTIENCIADIKKDYFEKSEKLAKYEVVNAIAGYIYILINPSLNDFEHRIKIGYSNDVSRRIKELSTTALPDKYHCYAWYAVTDKNLDKKLHSMIDFLNPTLRYTNNREFYIMTKEEAYKLLEGIAVVSGTADRLVINPLEDEYFTSASKTIVNVKNNTEKINISRNKEVIIDEFETENSKKVETDFRKSHTVYEDTCIPEGYYCNKEETAVAYVDKNGVWTILKGSFANTKTYTTPLTGHLYQGRENIIKNNIFTENVSKDVTRPSWAAQYVENHTKDGWTYWYTEDGKTIDEAFRNKK